MPEPPPAASPGLDTGPGVGVAAQPDTEPRLILGPLLRHVDATSAAVWVETSAPCEVEVLGARCRTFAVHGHHYAVVDVDGLAPATVTTYTVSLDGRPVWPEPGSAFPPSLIRTYDENRPLSLCFGSCRVSLGHDAAANRRHGVDTLRALAQRMVTQPPSDWPDAVLFLGDQVYADETSPAMREFIAARRDTREPPGTEVADFEEYCQLYRLAWSEPANRWLLSTLPSGMIFDDHDIRDDWNTSQAWREEIVAQPWWRRRVTGGLAAYWLYQHLGNMPPEERRADRLLQAVCEAGGDAGALVDEFAWRADQETKHNRWSYRRSFGRVRLLVVDSRCGRVLEEGRRSMVDAEEWSWIEEQARGDVDHLLVGTSLPYLLPLGIHYLEGWNEAVCEGAWGARAARWAERLRQAVDLEHWAAFRRSFVAVAGLVTDLATGGGGAPPATVIFLSGDVHYSYLARAAVPGAGPADSAVYQAVCSPIRNPLPARIRLGLRAAGSRSGAGLARLLARTAGVPESTLTWRLQQGPFFDNALATLVLDGRRALLAWETATAGKEGDTPAISEIERVRLS